MPSNALVHPIREHTRMDGRRVHPTSRLDFRGELEGTRSRHDDREYLAPGVIIGFVARYHYPSIGRNIAGNPVHRDHSRRLFMVGEYLEEDATIAVPRHTWHPQYSRVAVEAPVFHFQVYADEYTKVGIGAIAVACLEEGKRAWVGEMDHVRMQEAIGLEKPGTYPNAHIGAVLIGSLFYTTLPE